MSTHSDHMAALLDALGSGETDRFMELAGEGTYVSPATGRRAQGDELKAAVAGWHRAFPDMRGTIDTIVESDDAVACEVSWTGTHDGTFVTVDGREIPASGNPVTHVGALVGHYENGSLTRLTHYFDVLSMFRQMGAA
jgi:steroid delta-isomerase-like uncharacterized protein